MKKVLAALVVGLLCLTLSRVAGAASDKTVVDIAKGKGTDSQGGTFQFSATDLDGHPDTVDATGHVSYDRGRGLLLSPLRGRLLVFGRASIRFPHLPNLAASLLPARVLCQNEESGGQQLFVEQFGLSGRQALPPRQDRRQRPDDKQRARGASRRASPT